MADIPAPMLPALYHVGIVVHDLQASGEDFLHRYALDQDRIMDLTVENASFRDQPASFSARYGFLPVGNTEIELIQPLTGDSPYTEFLDQHGEGVHHLAFIVNSIEAHLAHLMTTAPDSSLLLDAHIGDTTRFVYIEGTAHGAVLELIQTLEIPAEIT
jgi:glyoxalase/bleomycin resistance protein/dioxygenase superfamily protein